MQPLWTDSFLLPYCQTKATLTVDNEVRIAPVGSSSWGLPASASSEVQRGGFAVRGGW